MDNHFSSTMRISTNQRNSNVDLLMISETKIDNSFPKGQFLSKGFCEPFRIDKNIHGRWILFYVREDVLVKLLFEPLPTECFFVEINLRKRKWLVCCSYNPHKDNISNHLQLIRKKLDLYSSSYERIILVGDFNSEINDKCMNDFCESYNLSSLIRESTCYKNPENPSRIDLFLMNSPNSFQNSGVVETGLSDFHRMIVTVMKTSFQRLPPKIRHYRDYSNYDNNKFRVSLFNELSKLNIEAINNHAPSMKKYVRGNHLPFMNKELSKQIMHRTRLRNKFLKNRSDEN